MENSSSASLRAALASLDRNFERDLEDLKALARIPSVSFEGYPAAEVERSAEATAELLRKRGLENVQILRIPGAHPYVYGERLRAPGKPTVLLYAHHDVQPPGRTELWKSEPFEPTVRPGPGGERFYGRGTADDKAGVIAHTAAIAAYLDAGQELPVNVKVVIEGEEEIGSNHLHDFLKTYRKMLDADVLVLTDCANFDCGVPALTVSLRGLVGLEVEVRALTKSVHSGLWGGPLPDPAAALAKMLAGLVDDEGRIQVKGIMDDVQPLSKAEEESFRKIPFDEKDFREAAGLIPSARILDPCGAHRSQVSPLVQSWRLPSLNVNGIQASSRSNPGNIINDVAWAKVSVRLVADMNPEKVLRALEEHLKMAAPKWGLEVKFKVESANPAWAATPEMLAGKVFEAAERAFERGYGKAPLRVGMGGSIPFVGPFAEALGGAPALLVGVEDPHTNAHGENESLLISDLQKTCSSEVHLFAELSALNLK